MKLHYLSIARLGCALIAASAATLTALADYPSTILSQGPAGYWRLSETTPSQAPITTAANVGSLGSAGNGTYSGSQGFFRGFPGGLTNATAAHFDGSSQLFRCRPMPPLTPALLRQKLG